MNDIEAKVDAARRRRRIMTLLVIYLIFWPIALCFASDAVSGGMQVSYVMGSFVWIFDAIILATSLWKYLGLPKINS